MDNRSFAKLQVSNDNYAEVESLHLDDNLLDSFSEKLLDMRLNWAFSATLNQITTIPYDFSQRLILKTDSVELSGNPWICTCGSQITDVNLLAKIKDKRMMTCGPGSVTELKSQKVGI